MTDPLDAEALMTHVRMLASTIGPRPTGQLAETQARHYIRQFLTSHGITTIEEQPFRTRATALDGFMVPIGVFFLANLMSLSGRIGRLFGSLLSLISSTSIWQLYRGQRSLLEFLEPKVTSTNLIARIPASQEQRHTLVFIGHMDSQKRQSLAETPIKYKLVQLYTIWLGLLVTNSIAQLFPGRIARLIQGLIAALLVAPMRQTLQEYKNEYVAGANDNATAVACVLGLGAWLQAHPLAYTEVWLVFTGAEEVLCTGMHHFLDQYGEQLRNAWFVDFEMVGTQDIAYVTRHSGLSHLSAYRPDRESLRLATITSQRMPELKVHGQEMVILEEIGTLRGRGFRGICLVGVGDDGWLANWHLASDTVENIVPEGVERAARFAYAMACTLDADAKTLASEPPNNPM